MAHTYTLKQAAEVLGCSERTLRRYVSKEGAPHDRGPPPRRPYLVDPEEIDAWRTARKAKEESQRVTKKLTKGRTSAPEPTVARPGPARGGLAALARQLRSTKSPHPSKTEEEPVGEPERSEPVREVRSALSADPTPPAATDLLHKVQLAQVLKHAVSILIERLPTDDTELRLAADGLNCTLVLSGSEVETLAEQGGPSPLIRERLGPGDYMVSWIGAAGVPFHSVTVRISNLQRLAHESEKAERERQREERARLRRENGERWARQKTEAQEAERRSIVSYWTTQAMRELASRQTWIEGLLTKALHAQSDQGRVQRLLQLAEVDPVCVRESMRAFLESLEPDCLVAPPWVVWGALDHLLPSVPDRQFVPWWALRCEVATANHLADGRWSA